MKLGITVYVHSHGRIGTGLISGMEMVCEI